MRQLLRECRHLVRAAALVLAGVLVFVVVRAFLVPEGFGASGHYRVGAIQDNRHRPLAFAGSAACEDCHGEVAEARKGGKHGGVNCEACHGPQAAHATAADPSAAKPPRPDVRSVCWVCHLPNVAKPSGFPQADPKTHGDGEACDACHKPHHPDIT